MYVEFTFDFYTNEDCYHENKYVFIYPLVMMRTTKLLIRSDYSGEDFILFTYIITKHNRELIHVKFYGKYSHEFYINPESSFGNLIREIEGLRDVKYDAELFNSYIVKLKGINDDFYHSVTNAIYRLENIPSNTKSAK